MFTWKPTYSVNIETIDAQHKVLMTIGQELLDAMANGRGQAGLAEILDRLIQYTTKHFTFEERLMQRCGYPGYAAHKAEHDTLVAKVKRFQTEFNSGKTALSIEVLTFLRQWLVGHIQGSDQKYSPCVRAKSAA